MKISYAVTVCNEHEELDRLLLILIKSIRKEDEIVVQCDEDNTTKEVLEVLEMHEWFDEPKSDQPPRLISFVFKKRVKD